MLFARDCSQRVNWDAARNEMETLATEQTLHSKADYAAALDLLEVCPELGEYMAEF